MATTGANAIAGDKQPAMTVDLTADLTGATGTTIHFRDVTTRTVYTAGAGTVTVTDAPNGIVQYQPDGTLAAGVYQFQVQWTNSDGSPQSAPTDGSFFTYTVSEKL